MTELKKIDFDSKVRLIGYYNKPDQTMKVETKYVEEATRLAILLDTSFRSLYNNKSVDSVFRSVLKGNTVFILKNENNDLYAYYPYKNIARITQVVYNRKHVTPIPFAYKRWFIPGGTIWVQKANNEKNAASTTDHKQYTITTAGSDFLITKQGKRTLPLNWSEDIYISIKELSNLIEDRWVRLYEYDTQENCSNCDDDICNNGCFNHRYKRAFNIALNFDAISLDLKILCDILSSITRSHEIAQGTILFNQHYEQLQIAYDHCKKLSNYFDISDNLLGEFVEQMDDCRRLNQGREEINNKSLLTIYIDTQKAFCVNRSHIRCKNRALFGKNYHIETIDKTYDLVSDSLLTFDYKLRFYSKDTRDNFINTFQLDEISSIYLVDSDNGTLFVEKYK